jgi:prostaglandin-endoperoxide synthase 2
MLVIGEKAKDMLFDAICIIIGTIMLYRGVMDFFLWGDDPFRKALGLLFFGGVCGIYMMHRRLRLGFWIFVICDVGVGFIFIFILQDIWHHHVWPHMLYALLFVPFYRDMKPFGRARVI